MKHTEHFLPIVVFLSLLAVYGITLAPGLTWANSGADGGDLITAAATGGVPHPTGYPVYLLLARAFQFLPIGSLAFRTNLLSALAAATASLLAYGLVTRTSQNPLAGLVSAYAFGFSPLLWSQAVITEVYALHAFFVALILYWAIFPPFQNEKKSDLALGLVFGIALGNHLTTLLLLPILLASTFAHRKNKGSLGIAVIVAPAVALLGGGSATAARTGGSSRQIPESQNKWQVNIHSLSRRLMGLGVGLLAYLSLPLRALSHPPVNWGNPVTLKNFGWLVSAQMYQDEVFALTLPSLWERIQSAAALLLDQFGVIGLIVGLLGLFILLRPSSLQRSTLWLMMIFSIFAIVYATEDSFLYFITPALCFAIWIGLGVDGLMGMITHRIPKLGWAAGLIVLLSLFIVASGHWPQVDASRDARAEQFGQLVMAQMPADTLVFVQGDQAIFSLWYFHYALGQRADIAIIASELLPFGWYQDTLKATYPSLAVPGPLPDALISANSDRPVCIVEYDGQAQIRCP